MEKMDLIIDIQFCKDLQNQVIAKEVAIASVKQNFVAHWVVAPPCSVQKLTSETRQQNNWLYRNKHGIAWQDGDVSLPKVKKNLQTILQNAEKIYVRGKDKVEFLQDLALNEVINLEDDESCPSFSNFTWLNTYCMYHALRINHQTLSCALNNVAKVRYWLTKTDENGQLRNLSHIDESA